MEGVIYKQCTMCEEWFPEDDCNFYKNKPKDVNNKFYHPYCKTCEKKKNYTYAQNNPKKRKEWVDKYNNKPERIPVVRESSRKQREDGYQSEYRKSEIGKEKYKLYNKTRSNKDHDITAIEWLACKNYFKNEENLWVCAYCGKTIVEQYQQNNEEFHREHVNHTGENNLSNCIPSCTNCNVSKWKFDMEEWYKQQEFFDDNKLNKIHKWITADYKEYIIIKPKLPYEIIRKRNEDGKTFHFELWTTICESGELLELKATGDKKKDVAKLIGNYIYLN